jgi:hypothetical protein
MAIILIHSSVALHVRDLTRFVVELDEAARKVQLIKNKTPSES